MTKVREGFFKVNQEGCTYVTALFWNPETDETYTKCVRDYDYSDCSRDDDELYYMPIDEKVRKAYRDKIRRKLQLVEVGDTVKVVKGRKVPIGTVAKVVDVREWRDCWGRVQTRYAYLDNGMKTSETNCEIL